jgi:hypothetical protein
MNKFSFGDLLLDLWLWYIFLAWRSSLIRAMFLFFLCVSLVDSAVGDEPIPEPEKIQIVKASVSNWQIDDNTPSRYAEYHYRFAFDGKLETSWGTGGNFAARKKDWIILYLERPVFVTKIRVAPGLQPPINPKSPRSAYANYADNGRPKDITLIFSDQTKQRITIEDFKEDPMNEEHIKKGLKLGFRDHDLWPVYTSWVWLQVDSIHAGSLKKGLTEDFGIAEIEIYGYDTLPTQE